MTNNPPKSISRQDMLAAFNFEALGIEKNTVVSIRLDTNGIDVIAFRYEPNSEGSGHHKVVVAGWPVRELFHIPVERPVVFAEDDEIG